MSCFVSYLCMWLLQDYKVFEEKEQVVFNVTLCIVHTYSVMLISHFYDVQALC